jgi:Tfp pilus assembly major pilin PilA
LNLAAYGQQLQDTRGFWMSFHEIISDYPWLVKRVEHVTAVAGDRAYKPPRRNVFAWLPALLVLRVGGSAVLGLVIWVYVGMLAAIAIPAYQDFLARSQTSEAIQLGSAAELPILEYYQDHNALPTDLTAAYPAAAHAGVGRYTDTLTLLGPSGDTLGILVTMKTSGVVSAVAGKTLELWTTDGGNTWHCGPGDTDPVDVKYLLGNCREEGAP